MDAYRLPAEWEPHEATWLAWPHNSDTWPHNLDRAVDEFVDFVRCISEVETVRVIAAGEALAQARKKLLGIRQVEFFEIATNDAWIRDYGPTFVVSENPDNDSNRLAGVDWFYNGWGRKYPPYDLDQQAAAKILDAIGCEAIQSEWVVEGGAIEFNGKGTLLTTKSCLLNENRRESFVGDLAQRQSGMESVFASVLDSRTTWLSGADLEGDDTDGHIDQQARFVSENVVLYASPPRKGSGPIDPGSELQKLELELFEWRERESLPIDLRAIPLPQPMTLFELPLPASYLNFYFCNDRLIVPQFGDRSADALALDLIRETVPDRGVIGLPSRNLTYGLGSFHCLTQQQPAI